MLKMIVVMALAAISCCEALAQGGCQQYTTWTVSGFAGFDPGDPGGDPVWQASIAEQQAMHGGIGPFCSYEWVYAHWSGVCHAYGYQCSEPPIPPAASPKETNSCSTPSCGSPIRLSSGNTFIEETDLSIPGLGGGLKVVRTWNSLWPVSQAAFQAGLFGNNWRSTSGERVFVGSDGTMKYSRADGSFWSLLLYSTPTSAATYHVIAPANAQATMTEQGTTSWTVIFQNGEQRIFDYNSGLLIAIVDRNGNTTSLSYDSGNRLISVADLAGRHLYFSYTNPSSYLVSGVTSDVGVSLSYTYDTQGRLVTVSKPDQTTVSFEYDANSFITAVKDQQGKILESHTYDTTGRG